MQLKITAIIWMTGQYFVRCDGRTDGRNIPIQLLSSQY